MLYAEARSDSNKKFSEWIHQELQLDGFEITDDLEDDTGKYVKRYKENKKILFADPKYDTGVSKSVFFRLSFGNTFTVHTLTDGVVEKIKHTKIKSMPEKIPIFMQKPFLLEARHDKLLFDNIQSIGCFIFKNMIFLLLVKKGITIYTQAIPMSLDGRKLDDLNIEYNNDYKYATAEDFYMKERKDIFAFALIFSILMEAERTPLVIDAKSGNKHKSSKTKFIEKTGWIEKRVYIDRNIKYIKTKKGEGHKILDKNGKYLKDTTVHWHLRLQPVGKGLSETKWVCVEEYGSKRWANTGDTRITVDIHDKQ